MRYRKLSATGDYSFGQGTAEFFANVPDAVAQAVQTRLLLFTGQWFLDVTEGTPYAEDVLGFGTQATYDQAIQDRIINTPGVLSLDSYESTLDRNTRKLSITATITTIYGAATVSATAPFTLTHYGKLDDTFILDESELA